MRYTEWKMRKQAAGAVDLGWRDAHFPKHDELYKENWKESGKIAAGYGLLAAALSGGAGLAGRWLAGRKARWSDILVPALLGFSAATATGLARLLPGKPYDRKYKVPEAGGYKPGDTVVVGVSGGADGPGSVVDSGLYKALGPGRYAMFRHGDVKAAVDFINSLPKDVKVRVIGHSYGGGALHWIQKGVDRKDVQWHAIDPVGWTARLLHMPIDGMRYLPDLSAKDLSNLVAAVGGRLESRGAPTASHYSGGHFSGVQKLIGRPIVKDLEAARGSAGQ